MVLRCQILFSLNTAAIAEAILIRTSAEKVPSLHMVAPRNLAARTHAHTDTHTHTHTRTHTRTHTHKQTHTQTHTHTRGLMISDWGYTTSATKDFSRRPKYPGYANNMARKNENQHKLSSQIRALLRAPI